MAKHMRLRKKLHDILLEAGRSLTTSELMSLWGDQYKSAYQPSNSKVGLMLKADKRFKNLTPCKVAGVSTGHAKANWVIAPKPELKALVGKEIPWKVDYDALPYATFVADDIAWDFDGAGEWVLVESSDRWMTLDQATEWIE